jgi:hypothetical protein
VIIAVRYNKLRSARYNHRHAKGMLIATMIRFPEEIVAFDLPVSRRYVRGETTIRIALTRNDTPKQTRIHCTKTGFAAASIS